MKLSKKFKKRYSEFTAYYDQECLEIIEQYELQPDDIEGAVILTVEEAKRALGCIKMSRAIADDIEGKDKELQLKLQERIEQAEMSKQST